MKRLVILGCSATKNEAPGWIPAIERYNGPLWQTLRAVDPDGALADCAFVSARYGFGCASSPIENYNERMTPELARRMIQGGLDTRWPRPVSRRQPDSRGIHAACQIAGFTRYGKFPFEDVAIVGGALYLEVMRSFCRGFREAGHITKDARLTEINAPIGYMRQQLRTWLLCGGKGTL